MDLSGEIFSYVVDNGKLSKFQDQPSIQSGYDGALDPASDYGEGSDGNYNGQSSGVPLGYNSSSDLSEVLHDTCDALSQAIAKAWLSYAEGFLVPILPIVGGAAPPGPGAAYGANPNIMWTPAMMLPTKPFNTIFSEYTHPGYLYTNHKQYALWEHVIKSLDTVMLAVGTLWATTYMHMGKMTDPSSTSGWFLGPFGAPLPGPHSGTAPDMPMEDGMSVALPAAGPMYGMIKPMWTGLMLAKFNPLEFKDSQVPTVIDAFADAIAQTWYAGFQDGHVVFSGGSSAGLTAPGGATVGVLAGLETAVS